jgi:DNA-binding CsgD family transcriptional regulator
VVIEDRRESTPAARHVDVIGREAELERLSDFLRPAGSPRAFIIEGEAGIGKTALWRAGIGCAGERGFRVLVSRPSGAEVNLSFAGLGDLLRGEFDSVLPQLPPPQQRALEAALALSDATDVGSDYRTLGLAVLGAFRARAVNGEFVVAIDDVQWLDAASARVLEFALRRLDHEPVALLVSLRIGDAGAPRSPIDLERLFALAPERAQLGALRLDALHELLRQRLQVNLSRPVLVRLHAVSSGNPFYALEIARALVAEGDADDLHTLPLTATLREVVQRRLRRLPVAVRETLVAAAALSRPSVSVLTAWAGSDERIQRDLERARGAGVVDVDGERIEFDHPLLAAGVYAAAGSAERRRTHAELARVVTDDEERARHLARAATGPDPAVVSALRDAAIHARARAAPDAALELLEEAIRLSTSADVVGVISLDAAEIAYTVGDHVRARQLLERIVAEPDAAPSHPHALVLLTRVVHDFGAAAPLLREARARAPDDPRLLSEIERNLASAAWAVLEDVVVGLEHARAAVAFAEAAGDDAAFRHALAWLVRLECLAGLPPHPALAGLVEAPGGREEPLRVVQGLSYTWAQMLDWTDELEAAASTLERLRDEAAAIGNFHALGPVLQFLALVLCRRGEAQTARHVAEEGVAVARASGDISGLTPALGSLAHVYAQLGEVELARAAGAEGLAMAEQTNFRYGELRLRHALGILELSLGSFARTRELLAGVAPVRWAAGYRDPSIVRSVPDEVEALVALGAVDDAVEALTPFEEYATMLERRWALGTSARCRGLVAAARGEPSFAWEAFERALELQRRLPEPYELARTLLVYGTARRRAKSRGQARELLEEALSIFERIGAKLWAERARAEIRRVGGARRAPDELTATERRVAELVADGLSNKLVARELYMSVKTVEGNLSRIYRKLGVSSRTQLARRLRDPAG